MKTRSIKAILIVLFCLLTYPSYSDNRLDQGLSALTSAVTWVQNLSDAFTSVDHTINKRKARRMAADLTNDVDEIIEAKQRMIFALGQADKNADLQQQSKLISEKVAALDHTITKYDALIRQVGVDPTDWKHDFYMDLLGKENTLSKATGLLNSGASVEDTRQALIQYFTTGIEQLKVAKTHLRKIAAL